MLSWQVVNFYEHIWFADLADPSFEGKSWKSGGDGRLSCDSYTKLSAAQSLDYVVINTEPSDFISGAIYEATFLANCIISKEMYN